ncbi:MAG TPA: glycosyltransferase [Nitrososphaeraceae archaeon]|jgi:glycosyltransferase involved in cell wall biosynthesis|nr:glycosyltransferase [Nitrososphaeraceae archaeon]
MGIKVFLCASAYPQRKDTISRIGIDISDSVEGFVKAIGRNEILPFLGAYQRMTYSYFFFKKLIKEYKLDFVLVTGGSTLIPKSMADKTIVYAHFPIDLEVASQHYQNSRMKKLYIKPWLFISNNLDYIRRATIITNSNYTKNAIRDAWSMGSTVIYPPCPQYSFPLYDQKEKREDIVCSLGRFTPEKEYEIIIEIAQKLPAIRFELVGSVTQDKVSYLKKLRNIAPKNVTFHVNATVQEKMDILKRSKVLLHSFIGEHFGIALVEAMSAGVIPVTHNSGAAKEDGLVPEEFRYNNLDGAISSVTNALASWNLDRALELREFAKRFSAESFRENMKIFLSNWIKSIQSKRKNF